MKPRKKNLTAEDTEGKDFRFLKPQCARWGIFLFNISLMGSSCSVVNFSEYDSILSLI